MTDSDIETAPAETHEIIIREPQSQEDLVAIHMLLMIFGQECSRIPVSPTKVMQKLISLASRPDDCTILMAIAESRVVGILGLSKSPYWYADDEFLLDEFFYVLPAHRDGTAMSLLIQAARDLGEIAGLEVMLTINNPARRRGARSQIERLASIMSFVPAGTILKIGSS